MLKKIILGREKTARTESRQPYLIGQDGLTFAFNHIGYDISNAVLILQNGTRRSKLPLSNEVNIPNDLLIAGRLYGEIDMYVGETIVKKWVLTPIKITDNTGELNAFDELIALQNKVAELEQRLVALEDKHKLIK